MILLLLLISSKYGNVGVKLYNIRETPAETINLAGERENIVKELKGLLSGGEPKGEK